MEPNQKMGMDVLQGTIHKYYGRRGDTRIEGVLRGSMGVYLDDGEKKQIFEWVESGASAAAQGLNELFSIALRHRRQMPSDLVILFKVIAMSEGLGAQLDPEFKLMEFAEPYFKRFWLRSLSPACSFADLQKEHGNWWNRGLKCRGMRGACSGSGSAARCLF